MTPTIRPIGTGERTLVVEATCHSRQPSSIPWPAWLAMYSPACWTALNDGGCLVADLDGVVVGFVVVDAVGRVFSLYVKRDFRGNGWGLLLLRAVAPGNIDTTADLVTPSWRRWCRARGLTYTIAGHVDGG